MTVAIFRWRAVVPLALFLALIVAAWLVLADRVGRLAVERSGTAVLGARVTVRRFDISLLRGTVTIAGFVAASPFDSLENLFEADQLVADLDLLPLTEKKVVIDRLAATGLRFGTPRTTSGFVPSRGAGPTSQVLANARSWAEQPALQAPVLQLATGKLSIDSLDPRRLQTVLTAESLAARADSSAKAWADALGSLDVKTTADTAAAFASRLQAAKPTDLGLINEARKMVDRVKQTRDRLTTLERGVRAGVGTLDGGLAALSAARQRDYSFAQSLVKLPPINASAIGWVLFGPAAVHRFQRALYYTQLGRAYMPPGLLPREQPGPKRTRRPGTRVEFPRERRLPGFLLRDAELSFQLSTDSAAPRRYAGRLRGLTSAPALYGRPTTLEASAPSVSIEAQFDHVRAPPRDIAGGRVRDVALPAIRLPSLPIRLAPGRGDVSLGFALYGDSLRGRWHVTAPAARWQRDSGAAGGQTADLVWRVLSGIGQLELTAELSGTIDHPQLHVRSNLDQAVSDQLRAVVGEEVAAAEARVRAMVDGFADAQVVPVRAQVARVTTDVIARLQQQRQLLDAAQQQIEQQLRRLTRGIRLP
ncbi:MAG: hypothetical protein ACREMW_05380 [Gemmatimonadales bacterium]